MTGPSVPVFRFDLKAGNQLEANERNRSLDDVEKRNYVRDGYFREGEVP